MFAPNVYSSTIYSFSVFRLACNHCEHWTAEITTMLQANVLTGIPLWLKCQIRNRFKAKLSMKTTQQMLMTSSSKPHNKGWSETSSSNAQLLTMIISAFMCGWVLVCLCMCVYVCTTKIKRPHAAAEHLFLKKTPHKSYSNNHLRFKCERRHGECITLKWKRLKEKLPVL